MRTKNMFCAGQGQLLYGIAVTGALWTAVLPVRADTTDISNEPLINKTQISAKPNVMFILDDSGSMARAYMPDDMDDTSTYGYYSAQCNGVAFDPATNTYDPPVDADGNSYPNSAFAGAWSDGYNPSGSDSRSSSSTVTLGAGDRTLVTTWSSSTSTPYAVGQVIYVKSSRDGTKTFRATVKTVSTSTSGRTVTGTLVVTISAGDFTGTGNDNAWTIYSLVNLSGSYYYTYSGSQAKMGWRYSATGGVIGDNASESALDGYTFYNECMTSSNTNSTIFTKVLLDSASAAVKQKYANWYSYYRTRTLTMRWGIGGAFSKLNEDYRVGFTTINETGVVENSRFLNIRDFAGTQKTTFFSKLYSASGNSSTPLRGALSKAGRYFANKASGQTVDPMQYSCQRNYAILSTDGYWNTQSESTGTPKYGPYALDNSTGVGQQDGVTEERPYRDAQKTVVTTKTTYQYKQTRTATTPVTNKTTLTRTYYETNTAATTGSANQSGISSAACTGGQKKVRSWTQTATRTVVNNNAWSQENTVRQVGTQVTTDGVAATETFATATNSGYSPTTAPSGATTVTLASDGTGSYSPTTAPSTAKWSACSTTATVTGGGPVTGEAYQSGPTSGTTTYSAATNGPTTAVASTAATTYPGGSTDSLADVAEYYYKTDLRDGSLGNCTSGTTGEDVCNNFALKAKPESAGTLPDPLRTQHMNTFTIGLGVPGTLPFDADYMTKATSSYAKIKAGTLDWPNATADSATAIDDLWHAAVNGRGQYFSALNAQQLATSIKEVLQNVSAKPASGAAVAASALQLVSGVDNFIFSVSYTTVDWTGNLAAYALDSKTGAISKTAAWSVQSVLDAQDPAQRKIYYYRSTGSGATLAAFTRDNLSADGLEGNFSGFCSTTRTLTPEQCKTLSDSDKTLANSSTNLVNWLRGVRTYEMSASGSKLYRTRKAVLGDIINGAPVYVGKPFFTYSDPGYADFVLAQAKRKPLIIAAANDGMLHAFETTGSNKGEEAWAYVPRSVMPNLYRLADSEYGNHHTYTADGAPVVGDVYSGDKWKTVLVAGLNAGGKGYYALDVTDPASPKALWEITDQTTGFENLGLTFVRPVITKLSNGRWVAALTSGYNNVTASNDMSGKGFLYIVDVMTGQLLVKVNTMAGDATTPSGLAKISPWVDAVTDNTALRFYGGDLLGNLWRFDIKAPAGSTGSYSGTATKLANFTTYKDGVGQPQPITTQPIPVRASSGGSMYPVIMVGTGRYLGVTDLSDESQQSVYAVKDELSSTGWGDFRTNSKVVKQTLTTITGVDANGDGDYLDENDAPPKRKGTSNPVTWKNDAGWMVDLPSTGERVAINMAVQYNYLAVSTVVPTGDACVSAGSSWYYTFDINSGAPLMKDDIAGYMYSADSIIVGFTVLLNYDNEIITIRQDSTGNVHSGIDPVPLPSGAAVQRASWRELLN